MDVIVLIVGTLLGVVLGYLIGRWHRPRTHVALHTADPAIVVSGTARYPRQAVSWNGAGASNVTEITFDEMPSIPWTAWEHLPISGVDQMSGIDN